MTKISARLEAIMEKLPLKSGMRVLEIGCGPGAAAREIVNRFDVHVLAIDRSEKAIGLAEKASQKELATGRLVYRQVAVEDFERLAGEQNFDLVFAVRVGALDGRHPAAGKQAMEKIAKNLKPGGKLFVDGREVDVDKTRRTAREGLQ